MPCNMMGEDGTGHESTSTVSMCVIVPAQFLDFLQLSKNPL